MSFKVNPVTKKITMHRGDTGVVRLRVLSLPEGGDVKVVFTMGHRITKAEIKSGIYEPDEDGYISVGFNNADTEKLDPGEYQYDVRVVVNPTYGASGTIVDGDIVRTPPGSPFQIEVLDTVGVI